MRILSLFSGCGGLDLGFEMAGFDIVTANEIDKNIWQTYEENNPNVKLIKKDIRKIRKEDLPDKIEGIIGGPPCQSWSAAGAKRGIRDDRGQLFYEYIRILKEMKPLFFLAENVQGMLAERNRKAVEELLEMFKNAGYRVSLTLVNAKDYGVAEERKRVFYIGIRNDIEKEFVFPQGSTEKENDRLTIRDVIGDLRGLAIPAVGNKPNPDAKNNNEYFTGSFSPMYMSRNRRKEWDEQAFTVQASGRQCQLHPDSPPMIKVKPDTYGFNKERKGEYRRMSVREVARLQGFPDDFVFRYGNIDTGYKMVGNAVPVHLAYEIALALRAFWASEHLFFR